MRFFRFYFIAIALVLAADLLHTIVRERKRSKEGGTIVIINAAVLTLISCYAMYHAAVYADDHSLPLSGVEFWINLVNVALFGACLFFYMRGKGRRRQRDND